MRFSLSGPLAVAIVFALTAFVQAKAPPACPNGQCPTGQCPTCAASCPGCSTGAAGSCASAQVGLFRGGLFAHVRESHQERVQARQERRAQRRAGR